jgi:aminopeptidase N
MRTDIPQTVKLEEYAPYPYALDTVSLDFRLDPDKTHVSTKISVRRIASDPVPMELDGENLTLVAIRIDGEPVGADQYRLTETGLTLTAPPESFVLETDVEISPAQNTALSGLYMSGGRFCTQCEAVGFRRITYWPDRPDVMSSFTVRMDADKTRFPILLSNGSPSDTGDASDGRHFATWHDPHRKPSYLFALCAGDYDIHKDSFTTKSGRHVDLAIHVDKGEADRALWAMDSLKRSMTWDEDVFGREYDLDVFNIVAVRDFNFGAMENKGLNIFNSAYVLADEATATDADFEAIESIVAHEYFHNWTGNRITCRDWFQLCLKEGLTVFRDQEFSADMRSRPVQRIKDVIRLRARQFPEDAGPLAHAVRPDSYGSIENLYTATVYEKGAELIRMLKRLIGNDAFFKGMAIYFDRHDGDAATIEDFYACFEEASGDDLSQFRLWYSQAGTPRLSLTETWDADASEITLSFAQTTPPTPNQPDKQPVPIPLAAALISADGKDLQALDLTLSETEETIGLTLPAGSTRPLVSIARGFSAPVRIEREMTQDQQLTLARAETDPFNRWDLLQDLLKKQILVATYSNAPDNPALIEAVASAAIAASRTDPALAALLLRLPDIGEIFLDHTPANPVALATTRQAMKASIARQMASFISETLEAAPPMPFRPDAAQAGIRALRSACMDLASYDEALGAKLPDLFETATSMTEQLAALGALTSATGGATAALAAFFDQWKDNPLVIDKWFAVQARNADITRVQALRTHPDFNLGNPNRVRALAAAFAMQNLAGFHQPDGSGHRFLADLVREVDPLNSALAARLLTAFEQWKSLEPAARDSAAEVLEALATADLSQNAADIIGRALG